MLLKVNRVKMYVVLRALQAEAQLVMQDVVDEILPMIEAELRKRLSGKLEQIVQEQLAQGPTDS